MTSSRLLSVLALSCGLGSASCVVYRNVPPPQRAQTASAAPAAAPTTAPTATPAPAGSEGNATATADGIAPAVTEAPVPAAPEAAPSLPSDPVASTPGDRNAVAGSSTATAQALEQSDHQQVVGHWGIEARNISGSFSPGATGGGCAIGGACQDLTLTSLGVRRWMSEHYAWNFGMVLAVHGGSTAGNSRDTSMGIGPTLGANFVLSTWKHFTVSVNPQLDFVYFAPSSRAPKTLLFNARALIEGELQLGFIGLPAVSVGFAPGLVFHLESLTQSTDTRWSITTTGQQSLWGLVTNGFIRFYL